MKQKNTIFKIIFIICIVNISQKAFAQVYSNAEVTNNIFNQNPFLDASSNFDISVSSATSGKGLLFPRTDLTAFSFKVSELDGINFPSAFSGMIIFNVGTGYTQKDETNGITDTTYVTPGFYYFYNPNAELNSNGGAPSTTSLAGGYWIRLTNSNDVAEKDTADITTYYGLLSTTTPDESAITGLTATAVKSGIYSGKFDLSLAGDGYFTVAVPVSWRNPLLSVEGNETFNVFIPTKILKINGNSYQVWQTDVELTSGLSVEVN